MLQRKFRRESAASAECPFGYVFRQDVSNGVESVTALPTTAEESETRRLFLRGARKEKKEQNRAEPFGGFFRCPRRVPPPQQQPGANVLLGVLWPADRGVVLKVCEGRKEEKKGRHTSILTNFALDSSSFRERISRGENPGLVATWVFRVNATVSESENCSQANSTKQKKWLANSLEFD